MRRFHLSPHLSQFVSLTLISSFMLSLGCATSPGTRSSPNATTEVSQEIPPEEVIPLVGGFKVNRYVYKNGLRLLVVEDHSSPTFAYQTWFRVGSRNETIGRTGLAHLFEHMMFKETKNLKEGEFDRLLEAAGAEGENAFTSRDYTAYIQELPSDKIELATRLESDRMRNLVVNKTAFKTEREVVQNERRFRNENSPDGMMDQELFSLAFTKHPYHWPVIGYQADLDRMTAQDALQFYDTYYRPNHATICVVGDVISSQVRDLVQKYYGAIPAGAPPSEKVPQEPAQKKIRQKTLKLNIQVQKLMMGYHIPNILSPEMPAFDVLQSVLTGGKSSRLQKALIDGGIATSVESYGMDDKDPSLFVFAVNLQKGKTAKQAQAVVEKQLKLLMKTPISETELQAAKNKINFGFYEGLDSNYEKAYFLGHYDSLTGNFEHGLQHQKKIQTVTTQDIQKLTQRFFQPKNLTVIVGVPK